MIINALNSGAKVFMADFEDSSTPTWNNLLDGQINLRDAIRRTITYADPSTGKQYKLNDKTAVLFVRPRGWHLEERHVLVDGEPMSGSLFDFRPLLLPQRQGTAGARQRALLLPAQDGEPSRSAAVERRLHPRAKGTRLAARHHQGHRAHRNHSRQLRDGRDSLRTARPLRRPELRPLGLHLQLHQEIRQRCHMRSCPIAGRSP